MGSRRAKDSIRYRVLLLAILVALASYATIYTVAAYDVARHAYRRDGVAYWTFIGPTFFPFPNCPEFGAFMVARMNPVDEFIYLYLIETGMLVVISGLLWILAAVYFSISILPTLQITRVPPREKIVRLAWVLALSILVADLVFITVTIVIPRIIEEPPPPPWVVWSYDADNYRDNYLVCIQNKTDMPAAYLLDVVVLMRCSAEKLANRTDHMGDLVDLRAVRVTYMVDEGYFVGTYEDCCSALTGWESECNVPYPIDCSEILDFIDTNHEDIAAAIDECSD